MPALVRPQSAARPSISDIPIPRRLRQRPRDPRGYPIPYVVLINADGTPDFRASNPQHWLNCVEHRRCQLCGQPLAGGGWFIGAPECEASRRFLDPAMHLDCGEYSLMVCPFLAIPKAHYSDLERRPVEGERIQIHTEKPDRFMLAHTRGWERVDMRAGEGVVPTILAWPWTEVRWWRDGRQGTPAQNLNEG